MKKSFFCSWSGGKDSCLALYYAMKYYGEPGCLFSMLEEDGNYSRSHRIPKAILQQQAEKINVPIEFNAATWEQYEGKYIETLKEFRKMNIVCGVFGDIDIEEHRDWCKRICESNGMETYHPLWKRSRAELLREFMDLGFQARIIVTQADKLGSEYLGRVMDQEMIKEFQDLGIDISGELGEYHTIVTNGPIFRSELKFEAGEKILKDNYWFLTIEE